MSNTNEVIEDAEIIETAPAVTTQVTPQPSMESRIEKYIRLRDLIKQKDDAHKEVMKPFREALETLNGVMLKHLETIGGDSVKSAAGTVYKTTKTTASLEDPDAFMRHVIGSEAWELLDRKANATACKAFVEENGVLPPGVKMTQVVQVGVRRS
jgi:hypothetical protein